MIRLMIGNILEYLINWLKFNFCGYIEHFCSYILLSFLLHYFVYYYCCDIGVDVGLRLGISLNPFSNNVCK